MEEGKGGLRYPLLSTALLFTPSNAVSFLKVILELVLKIIHVPSGPIHTPPDRAPVLIR